jgi:IclR helix-turn-helix domain
MNERITFDAYVIDTLLPDLVGHDHRPSAFLVYVVLWRKTRGAMRSTVMSLRMLVDATGLAKGSVQSALRVLTRRKLVEVKRKTKTSTPAFTLICAWRHRRA